MKILFVCSCLEPGKDGVGDYVQILAKELLVQQNEIAILAINDPYLLKDRRENSKAITTLRLNHNDTWSSRIKKSKNWISKINPDHIMWHFVIYGYHPRGLGFWPIYLLSKHFKKYSQVSIMFHELWIGAAKEDSFKDKSIGRIHKLLIKFLVWNLRPVKVFTSNSTYVDLLDKEGVSSFLLPIFSNIPFNPDGKALFLKYLQAKGIDTPQASLKIGIFGTIPFVWQKPKFIAQIKKNESPITLFIAGRSNQCTPLELKDELKRELPLINTVIIGEQPVSIISGFLQYIDIGITLTAPQLLEKSGVYAAYQEHGLPILVAGLDKNFSDANKNFAGDNNNLSLGLDEFPDHFKAKRSYPKNTKSEVISNILKVLGASQSKKSIPLVKI